MAALTNPLTKPTEFAGRYKLLSINDLAIGSASDTLTLSVANNGIGTIQNVLVSISAGQDAAFTAVAASFSSLTITITSVEQDGTAATDFTGTKVNLLIIGE